MGDRADHAVMRAEGLRVHFGAVRAVDGVSFTLNQGEIVGLIGPNGAGKTTVMNAITGFVSLRAGSVSLNGQDVTGLSSFRLARMGLARTFQSVRLFRRLTVLENVEVSAVAATNASRRSARQTARHLVAEVGLSEKSSWLAEALAYGEEQRVALARALAMEPTFLLLDEPVSGLNEEETDAISKTIRSIRLDRGCGILVIEHDMRMIMGLCDRLYVLESGKSLAEGTPGEIQRDRRVIDAYLGTGQEDRDLEAASPDA